MRIFLIGYMGSGKSTIGPRLARELGLTFIDLDHYIEGLEGRRIVEIFKEDSEGYFRKMETEALSEITKENEGCVVSLGGGTPCYNDNMTFIQKTGVTVYIKLPPLMLYQRLREAKTERPLLKEQSEEQVKEFIIDQLSVREEFYNRAEITVDGSQGVRQITEEIKMGLQNFIK